MLPPVGPWCVDKSLEYFIREVDMSERRVLIVEDEMISAKSLEKRLKFLGYVVVGSEVSGEGAFDRAIETRPDLILMDVVLKGEMDGIDAATRIRQVFDVPVVYLTASSDDKTLKRALATTPFGYLLKPVQESVLRLTIEVALSKHRAEREENLKRQAEESRKQREKAYECFQCMVGITRQSGSVS